MFKYLMGALVALTLSIPAQAAGEVAAVGVATVGASSAAVGGIATMAAVSKAAGTTASLSGPAFASTAIVVAPVAIAGAMFVMDVNNIPPFDGEPMRTVMKGTE